MSIVGIVAEYNPFHNGHEYQIKYAKEVLGATKVVIAMSGYFLQRGTAAVLDPWERSKTALSCGADMVIQIPVIFSTASAKEYAAAGAATLAATGFVDTILFGAETDDLELLEAISVESRNLDSQENNKLKELLSSGTDFAAARSMVIEDELLATNPTLDKEHLHQVIQSPNNILAIQYLDAIHSLGLPLTPKVLLRKGAGYHELDSEHKELPSATAIRHKTYKWMRLRRNDPSYLDDDIISTLKNGLPQIGQLVLATAVDENRFVAWDDFSLPMHMKLNQAIAAGELTTYTDCNEDLANRITNTMADYVTVKKYGKSIRSRNLALTRINRVLTHIMLGITDNLTQLAKSMDYVPYLLVLGVSSTSRDLLGKIQEANVPVLVNLPSDQEKLSPDQASIFELDLYADQLYQMILTSKTGNPATNIYTRKLLII